MPRKQPLAVLSPAVLAPDHHRGPAPDPPPARIDVPVISVVPGSAHAHGKFAGDVVLAADTATFKDEQHLKAWFKHGLQLEPS